MAVTQIGEWSVIDNDLQIVPDDLAAEGAYRATVCNLGGGRAIFGCNINNNPDYTRVFVRALYFDQSGEITLGDWLTYRPSFKGPLAYFVAAPLIRIDNYHGHFFRVIEHDWDGVNQQHDGVKRQTHVRFTVQLDSDGNISLYDDTVVPIDYHASMSFAGDSSDTGEVWTALWLHKRSPSSVQYGRRSLSGGSGYTFADKDLAFHYATGAVNVANNSFDYFVVQDPGAAPNNEHWRSLRSWTPGELLDIHDFQWNGYARADSLDQTLLAKDGVRYYIRVVTDDSANYANPRVRFSWGSLLDDSVEALLPADLLGGESAYDQRARHLPGGGFLFKFDNANSGISFVELDASGGMVAHSRVPMHTYADTTWMSEIDSMGGLLTWDKFTNERVAVITRGAGARLPELRMRARDDVGSRIMASTSQQASTRVRTGGNTYV